MGEALLGLLALGALVMALAAMGVARGSEAELRYLRRRVEVLEDERRTAPVTAHPVPEQPPVPVAEPIPPPEPAPQPAWEPEPILATVTASAPLPEPQFEKILTEHWLVWLGGITLALGGAFLVKYSFDQGWLGPTVRVMLGVVLGLGLIAGGHRMAGRVSPASLAGIDPSHVPPALVGAGSAIVFASLYAAFGLYDLIGPLTAFVALAAVAAATVLLALRHGPYVALLGLLGGHAVPLLIQTGHPNALALFAYLLLLDAGALVLLRWKAWWWLAWVALGLSGGWVLLWLVDPYTPGDELPLGLFLIALFGLSVVLRHGIRAVSWLAEPVLAPEVRKLVFGAGLTVALLLFLMVSVAEQSTAALVMVFAFCAAVLAAARWDADVDTLPFAAAALGLLTLAGWDLPNRLISLDMLRPFVPDHAVSFVTTAALLALLFGGGGFAALWGATRPGRWAALSAALPLAVLACAYWRLSSVGVDLAWAAGALGLAGALLLAGERVARWRQTPGMETALGAYAVGVLAALALAATIALEQAWLTVALALMLPGIAWVDSRLRIEGLRRVALVIAAGVLVRLALNPSVLDYQMGTTPVTLWLLYGYGLPMLCFAAAAWLFRRDADDRLVQVLEGGAVLFLVLLVSLEIRELIAGSLDAPRYGLAEQSLHSLAWLSIATGLSRVRHRVTLSWAALGLIGLATAQIIVLQLGASNPWLINEPVGERAFINLLLLAYGIPAVLYAVLFALHRNEPRMRQLCGAMALVLAFVWMTMEVRHGFVGSRLGRGAVGNAELYTYSAVWLAYAAALLGAGLRWRSESLRHAGLGMLLLEILKVFLVDMAGLSGLWRALSFLGLGAALIGVGYLYRRFVKRS